MNELNVMTEGKLRSNVVSKGALRRVQYRTLKEIAEYLMNSSGPVGSNSELIKENAFPQYTKDGHTILGTIKFMDSIENAIVEDLHEITTHIVTTVGDGTTSVVQLAYLVFEELLKHESSDNHIPYDIVEDFNEVADMVKDIIYSHRRIPTVDDLYDIAMISTNGNKELSNNIYDIYKANGTEVFINIGFSNTKESMVKTYDGLTLNTGFMHHAFINKDNGISAIRNPKIYAFKDPVATPELIAFFDKIVHHNIIKPYSDLALGKKASIIPTVIFCPMLSRDLSTTVDKLTNLLIQFDQNQQTKSKPPILIITDLVQEIEYEDIMRLCNCRLIINYINPDRQREDIDAGNAPDIESIVDWCGTADLIESSKTNTKIINPFNMFERAPNGRIVMEDGNMVYSSFYLSQVDLLQQELDGLIADNAKELNISRARRRLNTLKANMVDYLIGGITTADRDSVKHLAEDAVSNCRSASINGFGYGANFEAVLALLEIKDDVTEDKKYIYDIMVNAYHKLVLNLYRTKMNKTKAEEEYNNSVENAMPINLRSLKYDGAVLSSIQSDIVILDCIAKIVTVMFTSNQAILSNPLLNVYENKDIEIDGEIIKLS